MKKKAWTRLTVLDTKEITEPEAVDTVQNVQIGEEQFKAFTRECLVERTKPIGDPIHRNKLKVFGHSTLKRSRYAKSQLASLKQDTILLL